MDIFKSLIEFTGLAKERQVLLFFLSVTLASCYITYDQFGKREADQIDCSIKKDSLRAEMVNQAIQFKKREFDLMKEYYQSTEAMKTEVIRNQAIISKENKEINNLLK